MARKKCFTARELTKLPATEVIDRLQHQNYSLLESLGAGKLRTEMVPVGIACNVAINFFFATTGPKGDSAAHTQAARRRLVKVLSRITPGTYDGMPKDRASGLVIGFNHPSLGEIARIMTMKIDLMGDKPMYFPVNLPWYEALAPNFDRIKRLGIIITPTITPATWQKMNLKPGSAPERGAARLKKEFRDIYTTLSHQAMLEGGVIFVAPSATRQATVFKTRAAYERREEIIPTMSMLALKLYSDPNMKCSFLPMAILPPENYSRGLNFGKTYHLIPGKIMTAAEIRRKYFTTKRPPKRLVGFDWDFHHRIAAELPRKFWY